MLKKLWEEYGQRKASPAEFASQLFAATVPTAALYSQALANVIDFYLDDDRQTIREKIVELAQSAEDKSAQIMVYVYEALRLRPVVCCYFSSDESNLMILDRLLGFTELPRKMTRKLRLGYVLATSYSPALPMQIPM